MKLLLYCGYLLYYTIQSIVKVSQMCSTCSQLLSQIDCEQNIFDNCKWISDQNYTYSCQKKYTEYCSTIKSQYQCANQIGCAYYKSNCTRFASCSIIEGINNYQCITYSKRCRYDGTQCNDIGACSTYSTTVCESTAATSTNGKCKLDNDTCRDYYCSEADITTYTTQVLCTSWGSGCLLRGSAGCWDSPLPTCATYTGTAAQCALFKGSDNWCELSADSTTESGSCQAKQCKNATGSNYTQDSQCATYQIGCLSYGYGCYASSSGLGLCSTYTVTDYTLCANYKGSDGYCSADLGDTTCRARNCSEGTRITTDYGCDQFKSGCLTNGINCVDTKSPCSSYEITWYYNCYQFIGSDGNCRPGTSNSSRCVPITCADADSYVNDDTNCQKYQSNCVTNGAGCTSSLKSCTTYNGSQLSDCQYLIGIEGKCTWIDGTKCSAKTCDVYNTTLSTTTTCQNYVNSKCLTFGSGCVTFSSCKETARQKTCEGATDSCLWQNTCVDNSSCTNFLTKSICIANKKKTGTTVNGVTTYTYSLCSWNFSSSACRDFVCSDMTGPEYLTHAACQTVSTTCISDLTKGCINGNICETFIMYTRTECESLAGFLCTRAGTVTALAPCIQRTCMNISRAASQTDCTNWLSGCLYDGNTSCVISTTQCTVLTQTTYEICNNLIGYLSTSTTLTETCSYNSNVSTTTCKSRECSDKQGATQDSDCSSWMTSGTCLFDGVSKCVVATSATCDKFTGNGRFCQSILSNTCYYSSGDGTTSVVCTQRLCTHKTSATDDAACNSFLAGCVKSLAGGCVRRNATTCSLQTGTSTTCKTVNGGASATLLIQKITNGVTSSASKTYEWNSMCTSKVKCSARICTDTGITAASNSDCVAYLSTCRFKATNTCINATDCSSYNVPNGVYGWTYCTAITNSSGQFCGFVDQAVMCSERTCDQVPTANITTTCASYIDQSSPSTTTGSGQCFANGTTSCLAYKSDCTYAVPKATSDANGSITYCQALKPSSSSSALSCNAISATATACVAQSTCPTVILTLAGTAQTCNDTLTSTKNCQKSTTAICYLTDTDCTSYKTPSSNALAYCNALYAVNDVSKIGTGSAVYTQCIYKSGTTCNQPPYATCGDIPSPNSQADCDTLKSNNCKYYSGKCYPFTPCITVHSQLPGFSSLTDTQKALFCGSMASSAETYCGYSTAGDNACAANTFNNCASITSVTGNWDGVSQQFANYCPTQTFGSHTKFCKADTSACQNATCEDIATPTKQGDCDQKMMGCLYYSNKCVTKSSQAITTASTNCASVAVSSGLTQANDKVTYCQLYSATTSTQYCTYDTTASPAATTCAPAVVSCSSYALIDAALCGLKKTLTGTACAFTTNASTCRDWACSDITSATSQVDCDRQSKSGIACQYALGGCYDKTKACTDFSSKSKAFCESVSLTSGGSSITCKYFTDNTTPQCLQYSSTCAYPTPESGQVNFCSSLGCIYISGTKCAAKQASCAQYTTANGGPATSKESDCIVATVLTTLSTPCKAGTAACADIVCGDLTSSSACTSTTLLTGCVWDSAACKVKAACNFYTPPGSDNATKRTICLNLIDTSGNKCTFVDGASLCSARSCGDVSYSQDSSCNNYLKGCKSDGTKCVSGSIVCSSLSGDSTYCNNVSDATFTDSTSTNKCTYNAANDTAANCANLQCTDNITATDDPTCKAFLFSCVTTGKGCISQYASCTSYYGTQEQCEQFKYVYMIDSNGNNVYKYCSGTSTAGQCKERVCSDKTTATGQSDCTAYTVVDDTCLYNGVGCVSKSASCTAYTGTATTCSIYIGSNGSSRCVSSNTTATPSACSDRTCGNISNPTSPADCLNGYPQLDSNNDGVLDRQKCTFNGTLCVNYDSTAKCTTFRGNYDTCQTYLAWDGPCKSSGVGSTVTSCTPKVCGDAPTTYTTDTQCKTWNTSCYTTGAGCSSTYSCTQLTSSTSCALRANCSWTGTCSSVVTNCNTLTTASSCVNTKVKGNYCAWSDSLTSGLQCRDQTCADYPSFLATHKGCQSFDSTCTTTGAGCITISSCSLYTVQSICKAANSNVAGTTFCGWDTTGNVCRDRICEDQATAANQADCDSFLTGCYYNGKGCVTGSTCTDYSPVKSYCKTTKSGSACIYALPSTVSSGACYNFTKCEDITSSVAVSHADCQLFSQYCTFDGSKCISITTCAKTVAQVSCVIGTDGTCGWLPVGGTTTTAQCGKFNQCTDAYGSTNDQCQTYNPSCYSNGISCIVKGNCSTYTNYACLNVAALDGKCQWNATTTTCKLAECTDATANNTTITTVAGCQAWIVASGTCTTNGTNCVAVSTCNSYGTEALCPSGAKGSDGDCIWAYPVGSTTGTKSCRVKVCGDATSSCSTALSNGSCISDGTKCIAKAACSTYTTKVLCQSGGTDGTCAFTPTSSTQTSTGTCNTFSQCSDANSDSTTCGTNASCKFTAASGTISSSCASYTCSTITSGTACKPVPNFDGKTYTVCTLKNDICVKGEPESIFDSTCYYKTFYTYSWSQELNKCVACNNTNEDQINPNYYPNANGSFIDVYQNIVSVSILISLLQTI